MTVSTGNFAELLWPGLHGLWQDAKDNYDKKALYPRIFKVEKSSKAFEKMQGVTGLGLASVKDQGGSVNYTDPFQGYQKEYVMLTYGIGSSVTKEMHSDDQYGYINRIPAMLARSMLQTKETLAWNVINNGFTAGAYAGPDGVALFSNAHPRVGGGTFSNILATTADMTQTSLETLTAQVLDAVDEMGLKQMLGVKLLWCATANVHTAKKLMETDKVVGNADNDINPMAGYFDGPPVISRWLTDPDAWGITTDVEGGGLRFFNRWEDELERDNEFDTKNLKFTLTWRGDVSFDEPRHVYATAGA